MTAKLIEFIVQTPSGTRALTEIEPGKGFAVIRPGYGPDDIEKASQRLQVQDYYDHIHCSEDGTFINYRHLWSILVQMAKPNQPLNLDDAAAFLFYPQLRSGLHEKLMKLFETFDPADPYWSAMARFGWCDPNSRTVHRIPKNQQQGT